MASNDGCANNTVRGFTAERLLKSDLFGRVEFGHFNRDGQQIKVVCRSVGNTPWWIRWLAACLLRREVRALQTVKGLPGVPQLLATDRHWLLRSWLGGVAMQVDGAADPAYHHAARRLLRQLHLRGVAHNDTAKEPNWLVLDDGSPGLIDFQLASCSRRRGKLWRISAREDLRHLLKHKRTYCAPLLTARELRILAQASLVARMWRIGGKPVYLLITRGLLGWSDREGAGDRGAK
ncbi:MAG: serine/threonine protein kinase [Planctomycetota bacterium]|nr:MAG: serine/threonine protein kinase [Planctomycetota bacterium]